MTPTSVLPPDHQQADWSPIRGSSEILLTYHDLSNVNRRTMPMSRCRRMRRCRSHPWRRGMMTRMMNDLRGHGLGASCVDSHPVERVWCRADDCAYMHLVVSDSRTKKYSIYKATGSSVQVNGSLHNTLARTNTCRPSHPYSGVYNVTQYSMLWPVHFDGMRARTTQRTAVHSLRALPAGAHVAAGRKHRSGWLL